MQKCNCTLKLMLGQTKETVFFNIIRLKEFSQLLFPA